MGQDGQQSAHVLSLFGLVFMLPGRVEASAFMQCDQSLFGFSGSVHQRSEDDLCDAVLQRRRAEFVTTELEFLGVVEDLLHPIQNLGVLTKQPACFGSMKAGGIHLPEKESGFIAVVHPAQHINAQNSLVQVV